jgi:hypothetical protein
MGVKIGWSLPAKAMALAPSAKATSIVLINFIVISFVRSLSYAERNPEVLFWCD